MSKNFFFVSNWEKTSNLYNNWLVKNNLKNFFLEKLYIRQFPIWWITNLANKDNVVDNLWYYDLKKKLFDNTDVKLNKINLYFTIFFKILLNFLIYFFYFFLIKFFFPKRKIKEKHKYCFHSFEHAFQDNKKYGYLDYQYGVAPFKKNIKNNFLLISLTFKKEFFLNIFKKKAKLNSQKIDYYMCDSYIKFKDIIVVYLQTIIQLFRVIMFVSKEKRLFFINKKDCFNILYPHLLKSFAGNIQLFLLQSIAIKNFLYKAKVKNFINYGEFSPGYKPIYFFLKKLKNPIKIITIQHSYASKNILFFRNQKSEFSLTKKAKYISPMPDKYLVMGNHFKQILKDYFPNEIKIIGSLKYDLNYFKFRKRQIKNFSRKAKAKILICPTIGDEDSIISTINKSKINKDVSFILSPHPNLFDKSIEKFKKNFKFPFTFSKKKTSIDQLQVADLTICGFSSIALESIILGVPSIRVLSEDHPHFFDLNDGIIFSRSTIEFENFINNFLAGKINNTSLNTNHIFFNLDKMSFNRFWKHID